MAMEEALFSPAPVEEEFGLEVWTLPCAAAVEP
jgi:hypothetical protein